MALRVSADSAHALADPLQGVVTAGVVGGQSSPSPSKPAGRFATLLLLNLQFSCGVEGDADLPLIREDVNKVKGHTEGLSILNQALLRGILFY